MRGSFFLIIYFLLNFSVIAQPKKPVITGQDPLTTREEQPITIRLTDLTVTDRDDPWYPWGFTLKIYEGEHYSISGQTVTPSQNFNGTLLVRVTVNDGSHESDQYNLRIEVSAVNDPPQITGQSSLTTTENTALTIQLGHLTVTDPDNAYPTGFSLSLTSGTNYSVNGNTVTPAGNFTGTLTVNAIVNDGSANSNAFGVKINVLPGNKPPVITGQQTISTLENQPITLELSHLQVTDPDDTYPNGFTLKTTAGSNYTAAQNVITPARDFIGTLTVKVTVNDGAAESAPFDLKITVNPGNKAPVITGQTSLTTGKNQPITIQLSHLTVTDPDNTYPEGFTLALQNGSNYTVAGAVITPAKDYVGALSVPVTVNDGKASSAAFNLEIEVADGLTITGQVPLEVSENQALALELSHLTVRDPSNTYPEGFVLNISPGENYTVANKTIIPAKDFSGVLTIAVTVSKAEVVSPSFNLKVNIVPVNTPPEIIGLETNALTFQIGDDPVIITETLDIIDIDDEYLEIAEVGFESSLFRVGEDELLCKNTANIRCVFDARAGVMTLLGRATLAEYRDAIRSIKYNYRNVEDPRPETKKIYIKLNDGKTVSEMQTRQIVVEDHIELDIPTGFTPNNDLANDTWRITALKHNDRFGNAMIRVFNKKGLMVFETKGLNNAWDGKFNGQTLPSDTYYYTIDLNFTYSKARYQGVVTILR